MDHVNTLPRRSWIERVSLSLAVILIGIGMLTLAGWSLHLDRLVQPLEHKAPITFNEGLCMLAIGVGLLGRELGARRAVWAGLAATVIGGVTALETILGVDLKIDELFVRDSLLIDTVQPGRGSVVAACCIAAAGIAVFWRVSDRRARERLFAEAVSGSVLASVGFSTLLGYAFELPSVYNWGTNTAVSAVMASALFIAGLALLVLAWRESLKDEGGPPAWMPMPFVIGSLTLTLIFWIGLRVSEMDNLEAKTAATADQVATAIKSSVDQQMNLLDRSLSRNGTDNPDTNMAAWQTDAAAFFDEAKELGCVSVSLIDAVDTTLLTHWVYPVDDEVGMVGYDHSMDPRRREAIETARAKNGPELTSLAEAVGKKKNFAFVVYVPIGRSGSPEHYVAAEYLYVRFFSDVYKQLKLASGYNLVVSVGRNEVYRSNLSDQVSKAPRFEKIYPNLLDQRVRLGLTPTDELMVADKRYLPEMALVGGLVFTLLLGFTLHLARRARSGQYLSELSNKRLIAENEERRRIEARLKVSDERLRLALDSTQIGIFEWNVPKGHVYYSPGLWGLLGYEHARMPSTLEVWQSLIHPDDLPLYRKRTESQLNGIASFIDPEYRVRARTGDWRWVYMRSKSVLAGPNGRPTRIIGTVQDITTRRESEQALRESQAEARKLSLVASKTDNLVIIGSADGKIEWVNSAFCRVMEYTLDEVVGKDPGILLSGPDTDAVQADLIRDEIAKGNGANTEIIHYSKSGRKYYLHLEVQVVRNQAGQVENFIAIENDITSRVETENQLRRAKAEADFASRAKSEFLASMSHEIRTPMNGVIGMTSILMETPLTSEQRDFVNTIRTSGEALLTIINDILDFSKIESGKMELEKAPFELALCVEEALDLFAPTAAAKRLEIGYHVEQDVPQWIVGDVTRLRQIIVNLVNNAIKFTPAGSISIQVRRIPLDASVRATPAGRMRLEITVQDTGIGIPPDRIDRLFKAFSQVDSSTTRKYGGTGLGLAICQRLCQLMNGDIRVESTPGKGSTFTIAIMTDAAQRPAEVSSPPFAGIDLKGSLAMCIEDNPITRARLRTLFDSLGATSVFANDSESAVEMAPSLPNRPAILVLDLPEFESQRALDLAAEIKCPRLVLFRLGQTAPAAPKDGLPYATLSKPIKTVPFYQALALLGHRAGDGGIVALPRPEDRPIAEEIPLTVLLAEDNAVNQKVALRFLERMGYQADAVGNGLEVVNAFQNRRYDLVLMDLQMPEMDGLEASRRIRRTLPADRQPKIIALTANAMQGDREICLDAGMDDYISKPVKMHEIVAAIRRQFPKTKVVPTVTS
ncbi:MAG: ATP-binding protein [Opitutaceae bacterium]